MSTAKYNGRVDVYFDGQVEYNRFGYAVTRTFSKWTGLMDENETGKLTSAAEEIARDLGGEVRKEYFDPHFGHSGFLWKAGKGIAIVVVPFSPELLD